MSLQVQRKTSPNALLCSKGPNRPPRPGAGEDGGEQGEGGGARSDRREDDKLGKITLILVIIYV